MQIQSMWQQQAFHSQQGHQLARQMVQQQSAPQSQQSSAPQSQQSALQQQQQYGSLYQEELQVARQGHTLAEAAVEIWGQQWDAAQNRYYYFHRQTREVTWSTPREFAIRDHYASEINRLLRLSMQQQQHMQQQSAMLGYQNPTYPQSQMDGNGSSMGWGEAAASSSAYDHMHGAGGGGGGGGVNPRGSVSFPRVKQDPSRQAERRSHSAADDDAAYCPPASAHYHGLRLEGTDASNSEGGGSKSKRKTNAVSSYAENDLSLWRKPGLICSCQVPEDVNDPRVLLQCDFCKIWYHIGCVNVQEESVPLCKEFACPQCTRDCVGLTKWHPSLAAAEAYDTKIDAEKEIFRVLEHEASSIDRSWALRSTPDPNAK